MIPLNTFQGLRVVMNPNMVMPGPPATVRRTWKERLFTKPWRPWLATKLVPTWVPSDQVLIFRGMAAMHPAKWVELKRAVDQFVP